MNQNLLLRGALLGATLCCLSGVAQAQRSFPRIGADIGYAYLLDSKARAAFGSGVVDYGFGFGNITPTVDGRISPDISIVRPRQTTGGVRSDALIISAGPEFRKIYIPASVRNRVPVNGQGGGPPPVLPYYGASANLIYAQVNAPFAGVDGNGFGVGGSVFAGVTFNDRFYLEGRLRATTAIEGFNFSRAGITAGIRF